MSVFFLFCRKNVSPSADWKSNTSAGQLELSLQHVNKTAERPSVMFHLPTRSRRRTGLNTPRHRQSPDDFHKKHIGQKKTQHILPPEQAHILVSALGFLLQNHTFLLQLHLHFFLLWSFHYVLFIVRSLHKKHFCWKTGEPSSSNSDVPNSLVWQSGLGINPNTAALFSSSWRCKYSCMNWHWLCGLL